MEPELFYAKGFERCRTSIRELLVTARERLDDDEARKVLDRVLDEIYRMGTRIADAIEKQ